MKKLSAMCAAGALLLAGGCAYDQTGYYGGGGLAYDTYYDDYYGPFYDGYWGPSGAFFFSDGFGRPFVRDDGRHFRRQASNGFHRVTPMRGGGAQTGAMQGGAPTGAMQGAPPQGGTGLMRGLMSGRRNQP